MLASPPYNGRHACSDDRDREDEFQSIRNTLKLNGYAEKTLSKAKAIQTTRSGSIERQPDICTRTIPKSEKCTTTIKSERPSKLRTRTGIS
ncbi:hypothetical protein Trydic_g7293 [Trypoxylus dichotomus]